MDDDQEWRRYGDREMQSLFAAHLSNAKSTRFFRGYAEYVVDFDTMTQRNVATNTERRVHCRSELVSQKRLTLPNSFPHHHRHYRRCRSITSRGCHTFTVLEPFSDEYIGVARKFLDTCSATFVAKTNVKLTKIEQVHNALTASRYAALRDSMRNTSEIDLFHGTRETNYVAVLSEGLDERVGQSGFLGRGIYGSTRADYSHGYAYIKNGTRSGSMSSVFYSTASTSNAPKDCVMLYCKFLVGSVFLATGANPDWVRPPLRNASARHDSTRLDTDGTTMYAVYDRAQCCVCYAIHYSCTA